MNINTVARPLRSLRYSGTGTDRVLRELRPQVQWAHSHVADDKVYGVYIAPGAQSVRRHTALGAFRQTRFRRSVLSQIHRRLNDRGRTGLVRE